MSSRTYSQIVDATAKKLELATMLHCAVEYPTPSCEWLAATLRELARLADRSIREQRSKVAAFRLFGFKLTISRDG
ncbi:hypothetical protein [Bradyrhizobium cenepequi]